MGHLRNQWSVWLAAVVAALTLIAGQVQAQMTFVVDDDGQGSASDCNDTTPAFSTISSAVAAAIAGDTILVCPGTYTEQVTIGPGKDNLTLQSLTPLAATIKAPSPMAGLKAIVLVDGATGVSIGDFTVSGPGGGNCNSIRFGILVKGDGSATIDGNKIQDIRDTPFGGCQDPKGISVGLRGTAETGSAAITDNEIVGYQKNAIVVTNAGSGATISLNRVAGAGPTRTIAQNGIVVLTGATATISGNDVRNNFYLNSVAATDPNCPEGTPGPDVGSCLAVATGIAFIRSGSPGDQGQLNSENTLRRNQVNVFVIP